MSSSKGIPELRLVVFEARHLRSRNTLTGKSDPYCVIKIIDAMGKVIEKQRTPIVKKTVDPVWIPPQEFSDFRHTSSMEHLNLELWSKKTIGGDGFLGLVTFPVDTLREGRELNGWVKLQPRPGVPEPVTGDLRLKILWDQTESSGVNKGSGNRSLKETQLAQGGPALYVTVVEARNCNPWGPDHVEELPWFNSCNPYFNLSLAGQTVRGPTVKRSYHPTWNFNHRFPLSSAVSEGADSTPVLSLTVYHLDRLSPRDKVIGSLSLPLGEFQPAVTIDRWYPLKHGQGHDAWVRLLVKHHDPFKMTSHVRRTMTLFSTTVMLAFLVGALAWPLAGWLPAFILTSILSAAGFYFHSTLWPAYVKSYDLFPYLNPIAKKSTSSRQDEPPEQRPTTSRYWMNLSPRPSRRNSRDGHLNLNGQGLMNGNAAAMQGNGQPVIPH
eukprot:gb/GEZN01009132.1/.p1 GENE.gb/GEZN01009132.1/~~gb/GEZN01009132.1/.p1  ORF type:complete len:448 (-),score=35.96 gb/GEZN01009132.1/:13-1326(-)